MIKQVAMTTMVTQIACNQKECAEEAVKTQAGRKGYLLLTGQDASEVLTKILEAEKTTLGPIRPVPRSAMLPITGGVSDSTGGVPPPSTPPATARPADDPSERAFYLLDNLGDNTADGRVIAIRVTASTATPRGSVILRPFVFDGATLELLDLALSDDGRLLIVSQAGNPPQWIFIDTATLTITGRLMAPLGAFPRRAVIAPDGKLAYAIASGVQFDQIPQPLSVQVLDTATRTIVGAIPLPANTQVQDWAITPDQGLLFGVGGRMLHVVDVATRTHSGSFDIIAPIGSTAFVSGNVQRLAIHPSGDRAYAVITRFPVGAPQAAVVAVIDVRTAQKIEEWPLRYPPGVIGPRIAISANGSLLAVGFQRASELQVFDPDLGIELDPIVLGSGFGFATLAMA